MVLDSCVLPSACCFGPSHHVILTQSLTQPIVCFRLINPVVVSPTIAAVGLSFFSYGFTQVGNCLEIGMVQILLVVVFSLVSSSDKLIYLGSLMYCHSFSLQLIMHLSI